MDGRYAACPSNASGVSSHAVSGHVQVLDGVVLGLESKLWIELYAAVWYESRVCAMRAVGRQTMIQLAHVLIFSS